jgi:peptide methionine sulfoxide reductase msrA/msrB
MLCVIMLLLHGNSNSMIAVHAEDSTDQSRTSMNEDKPKDTSELKKRKLTALQHEVTQCDGTEPPFRNEYWDNKAPGIYVDIISGDPLFSSHDKFDSGTGWPSFTKPLDPSRVIGRTDTRHGMSRVEVRSTAANSHLGHVFDDGPAPTGKRYCINSAALRFIPAAQLAEKGYPELAPLFPAIEQSSPALAQSTTPASIATSEPTATETISSSDGAKKNKPNQQPHTRAILAGGCFWGMEELIRALPGVIDTTVGYTGGSVPNPSYESVSTDRTGHAEAIEITYDPNQLSFESLLRFFFRIHDPTTKNRQGNDIGTRYRSTIFISSPAEREIAERVIQEVEKSGKWSRPVTTTLEPAAPFYAAEGYHQDYLQKNPGGYTCHYLRDE